MSLSDLIPKAIFLSLVLSTQLYIYISIKKKKTKVAMDNGKRLSYA